MYFFFHQPASSSYWVAARLGLTSARALLQQPEIVFGTWRAARKDAPDLTEAETQDAMHRLDLLCAPAEQARIARSLVERVVVGPVGADIRLRIEGRSGLVQDLTAIAPDVLRAAA